MPTGLEANPRHRVVLVEDDPLYQATLAMNLEDAGFDVRTFSAAPEALEDLTGGGSADALILDWQLPGMDGLELLRRLRVAGVETPAIFLTALNQQIYEELALERGAVDFVEKSRSFSIILRRLRLITERAKGIEGEAGDAADGEGETTARGRLKLRPESCRVTWGENEVPLTLTEFRVVMLLVAKVGDDVSYREIYDAVRGEGFVAGYGEEGYRANVRAMVKRIRQKFRDVDAEFDAIENYSGFGYRWRDDAAA